MKPKNFPARKLARKGASKTAIAAARNVRTKKTPKSAWTAARQMRRAGKLA